jgi:hypothetical protein
VYVCACGVCNSCACYDKGSLVCCPLLIAGFPGLRTPTRIKLLPLLARPSKELCAKASSRLEMCLSTPALGEASYLPTGLRKAGTPAVVHLPEPSQVFFVIVVRPRETASREFSFSPVCYHYRTRLFQCWRSDLSHHAQPQEVSAQGLAHTLWEALDHS